MSGSARATSWRHGIRTRATALSIAGALLCAMPIRAYVLPVVEIGPSAMAHLANQVSNSMTQISQAISEAQDYGEYAEQAMRWKRTLEQYQQALVKVEAMMNDFGMPQGASLTPVDHDYLVRETCGGGELDLSLIGLFKRFVFDPNKDVMEQQRVICTSIRMMQNRKYNESLDFIGESAPRMLASLDQILRIRLDSNDQGNIQGVDSESLRMANELAVNAQIWGARMRSYDAYIDVMRSNQDAVSRSALKGAQGDGSRIIRDLVKTAALERALKN